MPLRNLSGGSRRLCLSLSHTLNPFLRCRLKRIISRAVWAARSPRSPAMALTACLLNATTFTYPSLPSCPSRPHGKYHKLSCQSDRRVAAPGVERLCNQSGRRSLTPARETHASGIVCVKMRDLTLIEESYCSWAATVTSWRNVCDGALLQEKCHSTSLRLDRVFTQPRPCRYGAGALHGL